jgi:sugar lactone lactonase YvrE
VSPGRRLERRLALRRYRVAVVGAILLATAASAAAVLMWPQTVALPPVPKPTYVRSFGSDGPEALVEPIGVAVAGGRLYVADAGRGEIVVFTSGGTRVTSFGKGRLVTPLYVALNPLDGRLYVTDRVLRAILVFDIKGGYMRTLVPEDRGNGSDAVAPWNPLAIAFTDAGAMYATDADGRQRILKVGPTGVLVAIASRFVPSGPAGTSVAYANGVAAAVKRVLVADSNNRRLLLFDTDLHYQGAVAFDGLPRGACTVSGGVRPIFAVADTTGGSVRLVDGAGSVVRSFDGRGTDGGALVEPTGVAHDGASLLYVTDNGNRRISVWRVRGLPPAPMPPATRVSARPRIAAAIAIAGVAAAVAAFFLCARERLAL